MSAASAAGAVAHAIDEWDWDGVGGMGVAAIDGGAPEDPLATCDLTSMLQPDVDCLPATTGAQQEEDKLDPKYAYAPLLLEGGLGSGNGSASWFDQEAPSQLDVFVSGRHKNNPCCPTCGSKDTSSVSKLNDPIEQRDGSWVGCVYLFKCNVQGSTCAMWRQSPLNYEELTRRRYATLNDDKVLLFPVHPKQWIVYGKPSDILLDIEENKRKSPATGTSVVYRCGRCGQPKRGHTCTAPTGPLLKRSKAGPKRRPTSSLGSADEGSDDAQLQPELPPLARSLLPATAASGSGSAAAAAALPEPASSSSCCFTTAAVAQTLALLSSPAAAPPVLLPDDGRGGMSARCLYSGEPLDDSFETISCATCYGEMRLDKLPFTDKYQVPVGYHCPRCVPPLTSLTPKACSVAYPLVNGWNVYHSAMLPYSIQEMVTDDEGIVCGSRASASYIDASGDLEVGATADAVRRWAVGRNFGMLVQTDGVWWGYELKYRPTASCIRPATYACEMHIFQPPRSRDDRASMKQNIYCPCERVHNDDSVTSFGIDRVSHQRCAEASDVLICDNFELGTCKAPSFFQRAGKQKYGAGIWPRLWHPGCAEACVGFEAASAGKDEVFRCYYCTSSAAVPVQQDEEDDEDEDEEREHDEGRKQDEGRERGEGKAEAEAADQQTADQPIEHADDEGFCLGDFVRITASNEPYYFINTTGIVTDVGLRMGKLEAVNVEFADRPNAVQWKNRHRKKGPGAVVHIDHLVRHQIRAAV